jgi:glycosyltransferase involved in cell wall biosynthesis
LRRKSADILHIQYLPFANQGLRYELGAVRKWQRSGVRVAYTVHDLLPHDSDERFRELYGELYGAVDQLICHNHATRDRLTAEFAVDAEHISVIPHGPLFFDCAPPSAVNVKQRYGIAEHQKIVLWQGIIHPYKGIEFLLEAWSKLSHRDELVLVIAGSGGTADLNSIREQVSDRHLDPHVRLDFRFLDLSEMLALYDAAMIVVYPYKAITTSGALSTGLSQGKAIIATALPSFMEVLRDGENALLINYGDTTALANAIDGLANDSQLRHTISIGARRSGAGEAAWRAIAEATAGCYRTVLARSGQVIKSR